MTRHAAIDFSRYKSTTILRRISRRMAVNHTLTIEEYRDFIATQPGEVVALVKSLLIQVTDFFRDAGAFEFLERKVMPSLIEAGRERGRILRFWSAGCATGEESYSLAIILAHMLGHELPEWSIKIFATDVDEEAIGFARRGYYPTNVLRNLPQEYRNRYFEQTEHGARISKSLRQIIIFGQQDLGRGVPFPRIDLVTCRNLLIYFKPELQQIVLDLFAYSLHQTRGYLFLGKAETARPSEASFELVHRKWKIYQCVTPTMPHPALTAGVDNIKLQKDSPESQPSPIRVHGAETRIEEVELRRSYEYLLRYLPVGVCLLDRNYRILSINAAARRLLGVRETARDQDFLHAVRGLPYVEVRNAIDRAFRERLTAVLPQIEMASTPTEARFVTLTVVPLEGRAQDAAMVSVENVTELWDPLESTCRHASLSIL